MIRIDDVPREVHRFARFYLFFFFILFVSKFNETLEFFHRVFIQTAPTLCDSHDVRNWHARLCITDKISRVRVPPFVYMLLTKNKIRQFIGLLIHGKKYSALYDPK